MVVIAEEVVAEVEKVFPEWSWHHTDGVGCTLIWGTKRLEEGGARYTDVELTNAQLARFKTKKAVAAFAEAWLESGLDGVEAAKLVK